MRGKVGWQKIVAIIDAAAPIEAPPIPARGDAEKSAARKVRAARGSPRNPVAADAPAVEPTSDAAPRSGGVPGAPGAAAPPAGGNVVDFPRSSQMGVLAETAPAGGDGVAPPIDAWPPDDGRDDDELDLRLAFFPHTDLGNAERFRERNRGKFLWCEAIGWLYWDGKRWNRDGVDGRVKVAEHETVRRIQREAEVLAESGRDVQVGTKFKGKADEQAIMMSDALASWGRSSEGASHMTPIAKHAAAYLEIAPDRLDADPFRFNCSNGTLVFRRRKDGGDYVEFRPHDPADLITKCSRVVYDPKATCRVFDAALALWQPSADVRRFLLAWQGLSLTGDVSDQKLCVFWGGGKNGKSSFIDAVAHVAGDYSETVPIETFLNEGRGRNAGQATPDLAILPGVRHLRTSEPEKGTKLAEALIKLVTGGEPILARHLNRDYFKFRPEFKLTISGNYRPSISGADEGIWRRVMLVPWTYTVPEELRDPQLADKLRAEASGILNRLLDGLRDWFDHGLGAPEGVREATEGYRCDSDPLGRFVAECMAPSPGDYVQSSVLHKLYCAWAKANGEREWTNNGLSRALKDRRFVASKKGVVRFLDVKMTRAVDDFVDAYGRPRVADEVAPPDDASTKNGTEDDVADF